MSVRRRVVVTGLGTATPLGIGVEALWDGLVQGRCGVRRIEAFDASGFPCRIGAELPSFQLGDFVPKSYRKSAKVMSRDIMIAVVCAYHAVRDAKLTTRCLVERGEASEPLGVDSTRFGVNIGAGLICADLPELAGALATARDDRGSFSIERWGAEGMTNLTPLWMLKFLPNMLACHVTIVHDAQGPSNTITCGEASSHLAIGEAYRTIARGTADVCICGGAESQTNPSAFLRPHLFQRVNVADNETPERASRPFAADASGIVVAEGGGLVILESLDHARARGARVYAEIVGFGAGSNTHHWSEPDPRGQGLSAALRNALRDAAVSPSAVDLVSPFGTGIRAHDEAECAGWKAVLGERLATIPAVTTRGAVGINGAGSGAIDFAAACMALHRNTVPPSINTGLAPGLPFRFAAKGPIDARVRVAVSAATALAGGQSAALIIRKPEE